VEAQDGYLVYALAEGIVQRIRVTEGQLVKAGEVLYEIENEEQRLRERTARQTYELARRNADPQSPVLAELRAQLAAARARATNDSLNELKYRALLQTRAVSDGEYRRFQQLYDLSRGDAAALGERLARTELTLQTEYRNAEAALRLAERQSENYVVRAVLDGRVYDLMKEVGEMVRRYEPLAQVGNGKQLYLRLNVDEEDILRIQPGQKAYVKVDALGDTVLTARVVQVYPQLSQRDQTFRVDAVFEQGTPLPYAGVSAEANILIRELPRVLTLPRACVLGKDSVKVWADGEVQSKRIRLGVSTMDEVEVLSGLTADSQVLHP
jgi:multidrug resistance efflux pump